MKIGVSSACYYPLETEVSLSEIGKAGIKTAEIFFNARSELKNSFIDILLSIKNEYGIEITSVHPTFSLAESFMIFSAYDRRLYEALDDYSRYSEIAAKFGAKYIIMHGGKPNGILNDEEYCERYMMLKNATLKNGVTVLQENVRGFRAADKEFLQSMVDILGSDAEFCIDIKQAIRNGHDPWLLAKEFIANTKHLHISDHSIASDCMLPGNGNFDFSGFLSDMTENGYKGDAVIEVYKDAYKNYDEIREAYFKLLKNGGL